MRTAFMISVGVGAMVVGLFIGLFRRRSPHDNQEPVSDRWIAEHRSKPDQYWP